MKLTKLNAAFFVSTFLISSTAFAHAVMKDEIMQPPVHNWTGFYVGLNAGAVNHTLNLTDVQATTFLSTIQQVSNPRLTGGLQVGYRRQTDMTYVSGIYGAEVSANFSNASFSKEYGSPFALYQLNSNNSLKTLCLMELIGGIAVDKTLLFLAAGLSWAHITGTTTNLDTIAFFNGVSVTKNELGTALGAGVEYAFTDKLSVRFKVDVATPYSYTKTDNVNDTFQISNNIVQGTLGLNYQFA